MELEVTMKVPVDRLRLDRLNPRLIGQAKNASDEAIIARLYRGAEIDELLQSMSANGYLDIEPLIVMQDPNSACLIVLEGNRRLVALRLLREADPINRTWASKEIRIRVPPVDGSLRSTFHQVSVYAVDSRERARSFIGFKHINGPAKWDAYAKAKFAADWYKSERPDVSLEAIAGSIGDRHDTIKRMVSAIYVLEQAEREELFDTHDRNTKKFNFSHLYTALSRSQYMDYLGLGRTWARYDPAPDPVPVERLDELRKMLVWIYGSKSTDELSVVLSSNRIRGCPVGRAIPIALGHRLLMRFHAAGIEGAVSYAWPSEGAGGAAWSGHAGRWRVDAGVRYVLPIRLRRVDDSA